MQVKTLIWPLLGILARHRQAWLTARLLQVISRKAPISCPRPSDRQPLRALVLNINKAGVMPDLEEVFRENESFELVCWPSYVLRAIAQTILSPQLSHYNYLTDDPKIEATKIEYRRFLIAVLRHYLAAQPLNVVLAGNFSYCQQREFGAALEELGTPFIAVHKENVRPPKRVQDYWHTLYKEHRGPFSGRRILVYNNVERDLEISSGVAEPARIEVTGMARLDWFHRWRREHAGGANGAVRPTVLFFAFSRYDKLTAPWQVGRRPDARDVHEVSLAGDWGNLSWDKFWRQTHEAIIDLARQRPDFRVVVKIKGSLQKMPELREIFGNEREALPHNLELIVGGSPLELIIQSHVIVGFNTTGLIEAIATGKPVIVPLFAEAADPAMRDLIIDLGDGVEHTRSPDALVEQICKYAEHPAPIPKNLPAGALKTLRYWAGNDDGAAGRRVYDAIRRECRDG